MFAQNWRHFLVMLSFFILTGCASTAIHKTMETKNLDGKPDVILVYDFAVPEEVVNLNRAPGAKMATYVKNDATEQKTALAHKVAASLSQALVSELQALHLHAERAYGPPPSGQNAILITGQFLIVDEGNRLQRMTVGFGAGGTKVQTAVKVYANQTLIAEFTTNAKSGRKPGILPMSGAGALLGHAKTSLVASSALSGGSELFGVDVAADSQRTAKAIVKELKPILMAN